MKIVDPGHIYEIEHVGHDGVQTIEFVRRRDNKGELLDHPERGHGILSQELLRVLIDRTLYLNAEAPCDEDTKIVLALRECLKLYESRASRRTIEKLSKPEEAEVCEICHHILCSHKET